MRTTWTTAMSTPKARAPSTMYGYAAKKESKLFGSRERTVTPTNTPASATNKAADSPAAMMNMTTNTPTFSRLCSMRSHSGSM